MQEEDIIPGNFNQTVDGVLATFGEVKCPLSEITLYSSQTTNISVFDIYLIAVKTGKLIQEFGVRKSFVKEVK
jgi:hypothetical protein